MSVDAESSFRVEFVTRRRVEFADTDMGGVVHFSRFFVFMENAEHLFLESLGCSALLKGEEGNVLWPRVTASCEFLGPVRFRDELDIQLLVCRRGRTSLHYDAVFRLAGVEVARGQLTTV
ncbi:MAG: thioesterase family protein, partial [Deferrisomatales bacterium]|nr:thioesterase family protein [Deferrisomatales bacterium]